MILQHIREGLTKNLNMSKTVKSLKPKNKSIFWVVTTVKQPNKANEVAKLTDNTIDLHKYNEVYRYSYRHKMKPYAKYKGKHKAHNRKNANRGHKKTMRQKGCLEIINQLKNN